MILFTGTNCPNCDTVKELLEEAGIEGFDIKNVHEDNDALAQAAIMGIRSVPVIIEGNSVYVGVDGAKKYIKEQEDAA